MPYFSNRECKEVKLTDYVSNNAWCGIKTFFETLKREDALSRDYPSECLDERG